MTLIERASALLTQGVHPRDLASQLREPGTRDSELSLVVEELHEQRLLDQSGRLWAHLGRLIADFWGPTVIRERLLALGATTTDVMIMLEHYSGGDQWPEMVVACCHAIYGKPLAEMDKTGQIKAYRYLRGRGYPENVIRKGIAKELSWYDSPIRIPGDPNRPIGKDVKE